MSDREELEALRRLAALESRSRGGAHSPNALSESDFPSHPYPDSNYAREQLRQQWLKTQPDYGRAADGMSTSEKYAAGIGKSGSDQVEGLKQVFQLDTPGEWAETKKRDAPLMNSPAARWGHLTGDVAGAVMPGTLLRGAALGIRPLGGTPQMTAEIKALSSQLIAPRTVMGGSAQGAVYGGAQPALNANDRQGNITAGGIGGGLVPALTRGLSTAGALAEPLHQSGREAIIERLLSATAGPYAAQLRAALRQPLQLVPGSRPTVAEVSGIPSIAALQRTATAQDPAVTNAITLRRQSNEGARIAELERLAGTHGDRKVAADARSASAGPMYDAALAKGIDPAALTPALQAEMKTLQKNPFVRDLVPIAKKLALADGIKITKDGSLQGMHYLKLALDDAIERAKGKDSKIGRNELEKLTTAKRSLLGVLDQVSPEYSAAMREYADKSKPINQMDVVQAILDKSRNPMAESLYPNAYGRALSDDTAQRVLGFGGATLDNVMDPAQLASLNAIKADIQRQSFADTAGRGVGSDTVQKLAYSGLSDAAGIPSFVRALAIGRAGGNLLGRGMDSIYGRTNRELASFLAQALEDPAVAQQIMFKKPPSKLLQGTLQGAAQLGGTAGLSLPSLLNAQQ